MRKENLKKFKIPDKPGVYFFLKRKPARNATHNVAGGEILYIGKATSLKDRVKSYFGKDPKGNSTSYGAGLIEARGPLIVKMVQEVDKIKWTTTDSVLEALILEAFLIKKHQPKYNTKEKSDKSFNYVCITKTHLRYSVDALPRVLVVRGKDINHSMFSKIFGPFTNGGQLKEALKIIRRIFPFLDEKTNSYKFYKQIDLVPDISTKEGIKIYKNNIKKLKLFFEGKKKKILKDLEKEMTVLAKEQKFERAGEIKRQIFALKHINDVALIKDNSKTSSNFSSLRPSLEYKGGTLGKLKIERSLAVRIEAYDIAHMGGKNMVGVMTVSEDGELNKSEYRKFKVNTQTGSNDTGALNEIIERRFNHKEWEYPDIIVVDGSIAQINVVKRILKKLNLNIHIVSVVKDEKHKAREIKGNEEIIQKYKKDIVMINNEAHRFAITYHKKIRNKNFLK